MDPRQESVKQNEAIDVKYKNQTFKEIKKV